MLFLAVFKATIKNVQEILMTPMDIVDPQNETVG